jgi:hypothetical protein
VVTPSDPTAPHRGELPERGATQPLDVSVLGAVRGSLEIAAAATANGNHDEALLYARKALWLLAQETALAAANGGGNAG